MIKSQQISYVQKLARTPQHYYIIMLLRRRQRPENAQPARPDDSDVGRFLESGTESVKVVIVGLFEAALAESGRLAEAERERAFGVSP